MPQDVTLVRRSMQHVVLKIIMAVACVTVAFTIMIMNTTPGHFGYPDTDGCTCFATYTTHPSSATCNQSRPRNCDRVGFDNLLVNLSYLDINK